MTGPPLDKALPPEWTSGRPKNLRNELPGACADLDPDALAALGARNLPPTLPQEVRI